MVHCYITAIQRNVQIGNSTERIVAKNKFDAGEQAIENENVLHRYAKAASDGS